MSTTAPEPELGELLMRATRGLRRRWAAALEPWDLSPHHARALHVVGDLGAPRLGTVAERLRIAPRSATEVVDALEERGLVERARRFRPSGDLGPLTTPAGSCSLRSTRPDGRRRGALRLPDPEPNGPTWPIAQEGGRQRPAGPAAEGSPNLPSAASNAES